MLKTSKKLNVRRETLRTLSAGALGGVHGGLTGGCMTVISPTRTSPTK